MRADNIRRTGTWAKALLLCPERRFWLMVGLIALGGAVLRGLVHEYGLPYIDDIDELKTLVVWSQIARASPTGPYG